MNDLYYETPLGRISVDIVDGDLAQAVRRLMVTIDNAPLSRDGYWYCEEWLPDGTPSPSVPVQSPTLEANR